MYGETLTAVADAAAAKAGAARARPVAYFVQAMLAGAYVGLGIALIFSIGAPIAAAGSPFAKLAMAASFGVALSLVVFAGSELFTGNAMAMTVGWIHGRTGGGDLARVWALSFFGNLAGSLVLAWLLEQAGVFAANPARDFVLGAAAAKTSAGFWPLFFRGVLCNWLVALAVWMTFRTKSDPAKLVLIFWALMAFIGAGYEHSVANMTLLGLANLLPHGAQVSWAGLVANLVPVTLGNAVSGALFVAGPYCFVGARPQRATASRGAVTPTQDAGLPAAAQGGV